MKRIALFLSMFLISCATFAQRTIQMRNIWTRPQVHVLFEGYSISFTIKDINKTLMLLAETGDSTLGISCGLDTARDYFCELYSGTSMEYHSRLQRLIQNGVGAFLLMAGHAYIENSKHKQLQKIMANIEPAKNGEEKAFILFLDPRTHKRIFTGWMATELYNKDLGID